MAFEQRGPAAGRDRCRFFLGKRDRKTAATTNEPAAAELFGIGNRHVPRKCCAVIGRAQRLSLVACTRGRATICLKWDAGTVNPASGLRYEVARALDNGILAVHLRNWQIGKAEAAVMAHHAINLLSGNKRTSRCDTSLPEQPML
jgi:hypothetical protein